MIEWIIGAAAIGSILFGRDDKDKKRTVSAKRTKVMRASPLPLNISQNSDFSEWRKQWLHEAPENAWNSKGKARQIIKNFPPFRNGSNERVPAAQKLWIESALKLEFEARNKKFLVDQKLKLNDFFSYVERKTPTSSTVSGLSCRSTHLYQCRLFSLGDR